MLKQLLKSNAMEKLYQTLKRKSNACFVILMSISLSSSFAQRTWVHPGAINNKADLDFVKAKIAANEQPWAGEYIEMRNFRATAGTNTTAPTSEGGQKLDGQQAYANALAWYYSGNVTYANNAIGILNTWGRTFAGYSPTVGQNQLQGGWIGTLLGPAAEIMRGYTGWAPADMLAVQNMFKTKFYPVLNVMSTWNGNVDLTQISAMLSIAVFCEDETEFNLGIQRLNARNPRFFYLTSEGLPSNSGEWFAPTSWVNGLTQESCRDNGHHTQFAMAAALTAAETAWNQGVDIYGNNSLRYSSALELLASQLLNRNMNTCANTTVTNTMMATWEVGYNHYANRKGMDMPNTRQLMTTRSRLTGASDWNIFYEHLTHNLDGSGVPICSTPAPVVTPSYNYEVGETATALAATGTALKWYTSLNGTALTVAPVPSTSLAGSTTFYVTQTLNGCEGARASIMVNVTSNFTIPRTAIAPIIDGTIDQVWSTNTFSQSIAKPIIGTITNAADLSGTFKAYWDNNYLYILGDVNDDIKVNDSPEAYFDDAIELYLDINNDKATYGANDLAYTFGWDAGSTIVTTPTVRSIAGIDYAMVAKTGGYVLEVRIPWTTLTGTPAIGQLVGFDLHVNDDDNGGTRDGKLSWNAATDDAWQNPTFFGTAKLADSMITTGTEESEIQFNTINYYPNPFNESLTIQSNGNFALYDLTGDIVEKGNCEGSCVVGNQLSFGVYLLEVENNGRTQRAKVLKK